MSESNEYNILIGDIKENDKELFFGPLSENDAFLQKEQDTTLQKLFKELGIVKNNKQAKDMGVYGAIPEGFHDLTKLGKHNQRVTILKVTGEKDTVLQNHELNEKRLKNKENGAIYTVKRVYKQWELGFYYTLLLDNGECQTFLIWENEDCKKRTISERVASNREKWKIIS